ncbi:cytochrome c biogenesis protein CcdA [bacterium]|nr:cytochrome c biogenesis protein CcdA [bacterium]
MLEHLFIVLTRAVEGSAVVALSAAFVWGILSIMLSPCHLSSIPLIIGFVSGQGKMTTRQAFGMSTLFALGILVTIGLIGVITAQMGRIMGDLGGYANYVIAVVFFVVGLHLIDVIPMPLSGPGTVGMKRRGLLASFILGLVFGIALGPCTFGFMAPVLMVSFTAAKTNLLYAITLLGVFGIGHCAVIAAAGTSAEAVQKYLNWNEKSKGAITMRKVCGVLVLIGGLYLIYTAP